ncbi:MAG TPA: preprotein translocase subunit SecE [Gemmatimonadaceae bacterium]|nr:preprotein translocase subunit SecE [Gemmatimonadaceae bacterium]
MVTEAVEQGWWQRTVAFVQDSFHEVRHKTTWPDFAQVRQASLAIVVFVLIVALFITLMDLVLNGVLQRAIPSLFR